MAIDDHFEDEVRNLINTYGFLYFFKQALDKQKVTRQIIKSAKHQHMRQWCFIRLTCFAIIALGLSGYTKFAPMEMLFLIPTGFFFFWFYQIRFRRFKKAYRISQSLQEAFTPENYKTSTF